MKNRYILSMDGGGVRTIASIVFLQHLEEHISMNISKRFDYFIGTSAGAISCLAMAVKDVSAKELRDIWAKDNLEKSMTNSSWETRLGLLQRNPKYTNKGKREVFKKYFGNLLLGDALRHVAVTSYDIERREPVLIRSYDKKDKNISLVDAGDATSAAPTYYPTAKVGERYLIDGAIVANHPVLHGYAEAKKLFPNDNLILLSIGTGLSKRPLNGKASMDWGIVGWLMHDLLGLMVESSLDHELAEDLIGENYLRINSAIGKVSRRLDDTRESNITKVIDMGNSWWDKFGEQTIDLLERYE